VLDNQSLGLLSWWILLIAGRAEAYLCPCLIAYQPNPFIWQCQQEENVGFSKKRKTLDVSLSSNDNDMVVPKFDKGLEKGRGSKLL
jgi:hypothetical protein